MAKKNTLYKCPYCGERFNIEENEFIHQGNRYYHKDCYNKKLATPPPAKKKTVDKTAQNKIIEACFFYYGNRFNTGLIIKQFKQMLNDGYTASGMLGTLRWVFEIKGVSPNQMNTPLGLIPYNYDAARQYYATLQQAQLNNQNITISAAKETIIAISPPQPREKKLRLFNIKVEGREE